MDTLANAKRFAKWGERGEIKRRASMSIIWSHLNWKHSHLINIVKYVYVSARVRAWHDVVGVVDRHSKPVFRLLCYFLSLFLVKRLLLYRIICYCLIFLFLFHVPLSFCEKKFLFHHTLKILNGNAERRRLAWLWMMM